MRYNFHGFRFEVKQVLEFRVEWDNDQWNKQYIEFKNWIENIAPTWFKERGPHTVYRSFAKEYYQDAKPETHDYWIPNN